MILYSIVIPCFNAKNSIIETIESVLNQTYKNFEIIVINDGSTDETLELLTNTYNQEEKLKIWSIDNSGGPARPRNNGILKAKGEYICFLDSDDLFHSKKLEMINYSISKNKYDIYSHHCYQIDEDGRLIKKIIGKGLNTSFTYKNLLMSGNRYVLSSLVFSKNVFSKVSFNESKAYSGVEDYKLLLDCAHNGFSMLHINTPLGYYRLLNDSLSRQEKQLDNIKHLLIKEFHLNRGLSKRDYNILTKYYDLLFTNLDKIPIYDVLINFNNTFTWYKLFVGIIIHKIRLGF